MKVKLVFQEEEKSLKLGDISYLLYNLELLHDLSLLVSLKEYKDYKISARFWYRDGRPLREEHKVRAIRIVKESPFVIEITLGGTAAIHALIIAAREIDTWWIEREKLKEEKKKVEAEKKQAELELQEKLKEREGEGTYRNILDRLEGLPLDLEELKVKKDED